MSERVNNVIWRWRGADAADVAHKGSARRKRVALEFCVSLAMASILFFYFRKSVLAVVVLCIGGTVLVSGLFFPTVYAAIKKGVLCFAHWVGMALAWILLAPFFYIFFTFGRLVLLISRRDPLQRQILADAQSYWIERGQPPGKEQYERQY